MELSGSNIKAFLIFSQKKAFLIFRERETSKKFLTFQEMETLKNFLYFPKSKQKICSEEISCLLRGFCNP